MGKGDGQSFIKSMILTQTILGGLLQQEVKMVKRGYCGRPEWADEDECPLDNPNEEMMDCGRCV